MHACWGRRSGSFRASSVVAVLGSLAAVQSAGAGVAFNYAGATLGGGSRWDAAPRIVNVSGSNVERSLDGGLRFSLQGGSYQAYRDLFTWSGGAPSVAAFTTAVNQAFNAWAVVDPATTFGTALNFVPDLATPVVGSNAGAGGLDSRGAEIDLFGSNDAFFWNPGDAGTQGETRFGAIGATVTLTSGVANYAGSTAISGADIIMNSNPQAVYTLDVFRRILTHEIGHTIGLGDVEGSINPGAFIDDNYNGASSATALATLTNSWAALVNPLNPGASAGLSRFTIPVADPGLTTPGVDILMESFGVGIAPGNPVTNLTPLTNDDFGTRQFLYPFVVPEPGTATAATMLGCLVATVARRRRHHHHHHQR
jgi:hypothetical protein